MIPRITSGTAQSPQKNPTSLGEKRREVPLAVVAALAVCRPRTRLPGGIMTKQKARKTTETICNAATFTDIPTDLIARLTREADRRCLRAKDTPRLVPLAHQIILARRED